MKFVPIFAALSLAVPATAVAQASPDTHVTVWHPSGKTPAAIPRLRGDRACVPQAGHHRGSKGVVTPTNHCEQIARTEGAKTAKSVKYALGDPSDSTGR